jgi:TPR repeat protein
MGDPFMKNRFILYYFLIGFALNAFADDLPLTSVSSYYLSTADITNNIERANHGDAGAALRLYLFYEFIPNSETNSIYWLKKASDLGNVTAEYNLAFYYENDVHPPQYKEAMKLYHSSAKKGNGQAMRALAEMYEKGRGTDVSIVSAIDWYEKAARKGKVFSMERAASLLDEQHENKRAYVWAKIAAIRRDRAKVKNNDSLLVTVSSNLKTNIISKSDRQAIQLDEKIPYLNYIDW